MRPSVLSISTGCCQAWVKVTDDFLDFMKESETKAQCWRILFRQPFGCFYSHIAHFGSAIWALSMRFLDAGDDCAGSFVYKSSSLLSVKPWGEHATGQAASVSAQRCDCQRVSGALQGWPRLPLVLGLGNGRQCGEWVFAGCIGCCSIRRFKGFAVHFLRLGS